MPVLVGTCGFRESQTRVFRDLDTVEVQRTFYQPPRVSTARRWRDRAGPGFTFTVKAWQLLTHRRSSPTYRRLREPLSDAELDECGDLRWNETTRMAWERTLEIAGELQAEAIVLQTPRSFRPTGQNLERLRTFLGWAERRGCRLVFEPRGEEWDQDLLASLAQALDLVHGVDPFLAESATPLWPYYRLHGRPAYNYRYRYSDEDLDWLAGLVRERRHARVLFNNDAMAEDARRLKARLSG